MNYKIILTSRFEKEAKKIARVYPLFKKDIEALLESLSSNPIQGSHLGHGIYKVRIQITGKPTGKRYGARSLHAVFSAQRKLYQLSIYDKSVKKDLNSAELKELAQFIDLLRSKE